MPTSTTAAAPLAELRSAYEALKARGLKLDLTRGKPSPAQLDLSGPML
ncbi:MAG: aminotransferase, partial [Leifsonia sp.]